MILFRRFALLVALLFWQGGFMFYGAVVVSVGAHVLGSELEQGFITQSVTNYLNAAGLACVTIWGFVLWRDRTKWLGWTLWLMLVIGLGALAFFHTRLDQRLDVGSHVIAGNGFYSLHRIYLAVSGAQWLASLALLALTLHGWKQHDQRIGADMGRTE